MAETYGNPHKSPPVQCSANLPSWTDTTLTANVSKIRKVHIDELRAKINTELTRRGITNVTFTDPTITANVTKVRKIHLDELRVAISANVKKGDCAADSYYCPSDTSGAIAWTDPTITANATKQRLLHVTELRSKLQALMTTCICEAEQCSYCSDCGYSIYRCTNNTVACADHSSGESCGYWTDYHYTGSINVGGTHPYKSVPGSCSYIGSHPCNFTNVCSPYGPVVAWDGYVPWVMGTTPPGSNWTSTWTCKCNPFTNNLGAYCTR